jgi:hypothetical protein
MWTITLLIALWAIAPQVLFGLAYVAFIKYLWDFFS